MEWLGLLGPDPLPGPTAPVDILTARMLEKMSYGEGERDMLVLQHTFVAVFPDRTEHITSTMIDFGIPGGDSSMNRTVGLPAAVGVDHRYTAGVMQVFLLAVAAEGEYRGMFKKPEFIRGIGVAVVSKGLHVMPGGFVICQPGMSDGQGGKGRHNGLRFITGP